MPAWPLYRHKSFAPFSYWVKLAAIVSLAVGLEGYIHYYGVYKWYLTAPLGLLFALIGLNIQVSWDAYADLFLFLTYSTNF